MTEFLQVAHEVREHLPHQQEPQCLFEPHEVREHVSLTMYRTLCLSEPALPPPPPLMITDLTRESALAELTDLFRTVQVPAHLDWGEFLAGTDWGEFCTRHGRNPEEQTPPNYAPEFLSRCIMSSAPSAPAEYRRSRQFQQCVYIAARQLRRDLTSTQRGGPRVRSLR